MAEELSVGIGSISTDSVNKSEGSNDNGEPIYYGAIYNRLTKTIIPFITPDEVSWNHSANFDEVTIDGRSVAIPGYKGGSSPKVSFEVLLHDDFYLTRLSKSNSAVTADQLVASAGSVPSTLLEVRNAIRALTFPEYYKGVPSPPECVVMIGDSVKFIGKCNDVSEVMKGLTGSDAKGKRVYKQSSLSLSFTVIREVGSSSYDAPSATQVEEGQVSLS
jgi:hypothetical protein